MNWLVVVTYLAGNAWGPTAQVTHMPSAEICAAMRTSTADDIYKASATNLTGGGVLREDNGALVIQGVSGRVVARVSCKNAKALSKVAKVAPPSIDDQMRAALPKE